MKSITSPSTEVAVLELKSPPPPPHGIVTVTLLRERVAVTQAHTKSTSLTVQAVPSAMPSSSNCIAVFQPPPATTLSIFSLMVVVELYAMSFQVSAQELLGLRIIEVLSIRAKPLSVIAVIS